MKKGNIIVSVLCAILGITVIAIASGYPTTADYGTGVPGPGLWPICISVVMLLCAAILVIYTILLHPVGFILTTTAMLFTFIQWFGKKKIYITFAISAAATLVVYFAFKYLLNVPMAFGLFSI